MSKKKTLDVIVKLKEKLVCIEINSCYYEGLHERNASYTFSKYSEQMKVGDRYTDMIPLIQINFTKGLPKDYPMVGEYTLSDLNTKINFIDNFKILEFNVDKIKEKCYTEDGKRYNFVAILDMDKEELKHIVKEINIWKNMKMK